MDVAEHLKQFTNNETFRRWLTDTVFGLTCDSLGIASPPSV